MNVWMFDADVEIWGNISTEYHLIKSMIIVWSEMWDMSKSVQVYININGRAIDS